MTDPNSSSKSSNQQPNPLKGQSFATVPELDHKWKNRCRQSSIIKCAAATELVAIHQGKEEGGSGREFKSVSREGRGVK
jgi:hypothetical protein